LDHLRKFGRLCETCGKQKAAEKENFFHVGIQKKDRKRMQQKDPLSIES
jgi:hypothetical protein